MKQSAQSIIPRRVKGIYKGPSIAPTVRIAVPRTRTAGLLTGCSAGLQTRTDQNAITKSCSQGATAPRIESFRIHMGVTYALSNISLRGIRVSALVAGFASIATRTLPVVGTTGRGSA